MLKFLLLLLSIQALNAFSHGGGLDRNGGHHNRKTGEYHCHREPCVSARSQVKEATREADRRSYDYSKLYDRDDWGGWIDEDGDCQNTRAEILIRDSKAPVGLDGCRVVSGLWDLPYWGGTARSATQVDIDHIIPLKWAHGHGGDQWSYKKKRQFANDPANLIAVSKKANSSKGAKGPDQWMPLKNKCEYVKKWRSLVTKYRLRVIKSERSALEKPCT